MILHMHTAFVLVSYTSRQLVHHNGTHIRVVT